MGFSVHSSSWLSVVCTRLPQASILRPEDRLSLKCGFYLRIYSNNLLSEIKLRGLNAVDMCKCVLGLH